MFRKKLKLKVIKFKPHVGELHVSYQLLLFVLVFAALGTYLIWHSLAATPVVGTLNAQQMVLSTTGALPTGKNKIADSGASNGYAVKLTKSSTSLTGKVTLSASATSLTVRARQQTACMSYPPLMTVSLSYATGTTTVLTQQVTATGWTSYSVPLSTTTTGSQGTHTLTIKFTHGATTCNTDNLLLDATIFYGSAPVPIPAPTLSFSASPTTVNAGAASTLTWGSTNATTCTGSGAWSGSKPLSGSVSTGALNATTSYTLTCTGSTGTTPATASATITVTSPPPPPPTTGGSPQTIWVPSSPSSPYKPLSDSAAAALVTHKPEIHPSNVTPNNYVPTVAELQAFHSACNPGYLHDPNCQYVTGTPGLVNPSTDDLIQWAAHKWGIPEDWIRAEAVFESHWYQDVRDPTTGIGINGKGFGDNTNVGATEVPLYPPQSRISSTNVYQSLGIMQARWFGSKSSTSAHPGIEPLRWESTAFNLDHYGNYVRWLYDGGCSWCGTIYTAPADPWNSIGGWYGGPVGTPTTPYTQQWYIATVQGILAQRTWAQAGF